jgi:hypothetical protein
VLVQEEAIQRFRESAGSSYKMVTRLPEENEKPLIKNE